MNFIGGAQHGRAVPEADRARHTLVVGLQYYVRHLDHFVIFGMTPANATSLILELSTCKA